MDKQTALKTTRSKPKNVRVVVNPAPSRKIPLLAILNQAFRDAGIHWDLDITHGTGDGHDLAKKAVEEGADVVAVYGGDGTVMEVASAMIDTDVPMLLLGGGTGNLVASELRVPTVLERSCELVCREQHNVRTIDVGLLNGKPFLLRVGCGLETGVVQDATREFKDQFGKWAYIFAGIKAIQEGGSADYDIIVDGKKVVSGTRGVACAIANAGTVGVGRLGLSPVVDIDDGQLNIFFLKQANLEGIKDLAMKMMGLDQLKNMVGEPILDASDLLSEWHGEKIEVHTNPVQDVQADGDVVGQTPMLAEIKPACLKVVVP